MTDQREEHEVFPGSEHGITGGDLIEMASKDEFDLDQLNERLVSLGVEPISGGKPVQHQKDETLANKPVEEQSSAILSGSLKEKRYTKGAFSQLSSFVSNISRAVALVPTGVFNHIKRLTPNMSKKYTASQPEGSLFAAKFLKIKKILIAALHSLTKRSKKKLPDSAVQAVDGVDTSSRPKSSVLFARITVILFWIGVPIIALLLTAGTLLAVVQIRDNYQTLGEEQPAEEETPSKASESGRWEYIPWTPEPATPPPLQIITEEE